MRLRLVAVTRLVAYANVQGCWPRHVLLVKLARIVFNVFMHLGPKLFVPKSANCVQIRRGHVGPRNPQRLVQIRVLIMRLIARLKGTRLTVAPRRGDAANVSREALTIASLSQRLPSIG